MRADVVAAVCATAVALLTTARAFEPASLLQSFTYLEWNWQSPAQRSAYFASGAASCQPVGVRMDHLGSEWDAQPDPARRAMHTLVSSRSRALLMRGCTPW